MDKLKSSNLSKVLLIGDVNDNLLESLLEKQKTFAFLLIFSFRKNSHTKISLLVIDFVEFTHAK
uniref:Uncharacterized protein n=1 Tax=Wuchereria bancrofti TaxID=6293 RepID=A0A1I8EMA6_WUCBA